MLVAEKNKLTKESLEKFGYSYDYENDFLKMFSKKNSNVQNIVISLYPRLNEDGKIILARMHNDNIVFNSNNERFIICTKDNNVILNILYSKITLCYVKKVENLIEFVFGYDDNIFYRMTFVNR